MGQLTATGERVVDAAVERVRAALADYAYVRPKILTEKYSGYALHQGGRGGGTVASWTFHATSKRTRDCLVDVTEPAPGRLVETDRNSSLVTTITAEAVDGEPDRTRVAISTVWQGASGVGGFFERRFAPGGLARDHEQLIGKLEDHLRDS